MRAALLACLLASQALAQDAGIPLDAPTVERLKAGQPAPWPGVLMTEAESVAVANEVQTGRSKVPLKVLAVSAAVCLAGGVALGIAIGRATKP